MLIHIYIYLTIKMQTKHALILAVLITGLIASNFYLFSMLKSESIQRQTAIVARVIDGDTLVLQDGTKIRLLNVNAPEKSTKIYQLALNYLKQFENKSVNLEITEQDKYGRTLARIYSPNYINLELVSLGFASKFLVDESELSQFNEAEKSVVQQEKGIWRHSQYFSCIKSEIDKYSEVVILSNSCPEINFKGWILKDESTKSFVFPEIKFDKIKLHSESGKNNSTDLFWNQKTNVWNDDRDSLYLFDSQSNIANYNSYGY